MLDRIFEKICDCCSVKHENQVPSIGKGSSIIQASDQQLLFYQKIRKANQEKNKDSFQGKVPDIHV